MRCINCGWDNQPGAIKCVKCGKVLEGGDDGLQAAQQPMGVQAMPTSNGEMSRPTVVGVQQMPEPRPTVVGSGMQPQEPLSRPTTVMQPGQMDASTAMPPRPTVIGAAGAVPQQQPVPERATVAIPADELGPVAEMPPVPESDDGCCPACGYPIVGSPAKCPACGHTLAAARQNAAVANTKAATAPAQPDIAPMVAGRQTVVGDFAHHFAPRQQSQPQPEPQRQTPPRCSLTLIPEETEKDLELKNDYEGENIVLNRHNTEPDNRTITSREQAVLIHENGQWFIEDRSDLKSTFIRVSHRMALQPGDVIVLGDRRFTFNEEQ